MKNIFFSLKMSHHFNEHFSKVLMATPIDYILFSVSDFIELLLYYYLI